MGMFDKIEKKGNTITPDYGDDGIDKVKCSEECMYKDVHGTCLFETCIYKVHPFSIPMHDTFTRKCDFCNETYTIITNTSIVTSMLRYSLCSKCINVLKKQVMEKRDDG